MNSIYLRLLNTAGLIFLITMNMLAVFLPLGSKTTGELSDLYPNLFVPAGFTFSIWGIIYILLIVFVGYQWFAEKHRAVIHTVGFWFGLNAVANGLWLVFWHNEHVLICLFIMAILLGSLIMIYRKMDIKYFNESPTSLLASIPISVYLGWISVATIANVTVVLVSSGVTELGIGADAWASIVLLVAVAIALRMLYVHKDIFFAMVVCWASFGIYSKRAADMIIQDPKIEHTSYISMYIVGIAIILTVVQSLLKRNKSI